MGIANRLGRWLIIATIGGFAASAAAQTQTLRIATYNLEADINGATLPNYGTDAVIEGTGEQNYHGIEKAADIVALQETTSNTITVDPLLDELNSYYGTSVYARSPLQGLSNGGVVNFGNGPNAIIYNTNTVQLISSVGVGTPIGSFNGMYRQAMRYQFQPLGGSAANSFYVYVTHMKSSFSGDPYVNEFYRNGEAQIIRADAATLATAANPNPSILYLGDFNLSGSATISDGAGHSVSAYQTMTAAGAGRAVDPLNMPQDNTITWAGNPAYASIMTESVYDLYYRDDLELMTQNVFDGTASSGLKYIPGSLHTFGNDGSIGVGGYVFDSNNTALNDIDPNGPIPADYLPIYLYYASDHFPVVADYWIAVPEPSALVLLGACAMCLLKFRTVSKRNAESYQRLGPVLAPYA